MNPEQPSGIKNQKMIVPGITTVPGADPGVAMQEVPPVTQTEIIELCSP